MAWEADFLRGFGLWSADEPALFDRLERSFWLDLWRAPVLDAVEEQGIEARRFGPVQATMVAELQQTPLLNLVLGAGEPGAVDEGHLMSALEWAESLDVDFRIPITQGQPEAAAAEDMLNQRGYRRRGCLARFVRKTKPLELPAPPGIEVIEVDEPLEGFSDYLGRGLALSLSADSFFDCLPGREMWRCYVALDERDHPIGAATMVRNDLKVAQLGFAATVEAARGKGAHLAMLRRCILDAQAVGCGAVVAETEESLDETDDLSAAARNLVRAGFAQVAVRPVWHPS